MKSVEKIINDIEGLRPIPYTYNKIIEMTKNPDSSINELVDIITYDQGATANILRACNSSYFGLSRKITSIKHAITYMGLDRLVNLIIVDSAASNFRRGQAGYDLTEGELWRYSVFSALIAQSLAEKNQQKNISYIFTSALLKDIGKVILHTYVNDSFNEIIFMVKEKGLTFIEAEKEVIGINHAELGAKVAAKWNFSPNMVNIIKNHHFPELAPPDDLSIPIVYLADSICMMMGIGVGSDGLAYRYHQEVMDKLHFSNIDVQKTIADSLEKLKDVEQLVNSTGGN